MEWGGVIGGVLGTAGSVWNNERNIAFQRETNAHNEELMREAWGREDTAVQRRSADMAAAGFNPVLATGAAASSMPAVRAEAPQARENVGASAIAGAQAAVDISRTQAETARIRAEARKANVEAEIMEGRDPVSNMSYKMMRLVQEYGRTLEASFKQEESKAGIADLENQAGYRLARSRFMEAHGAELLELELRMKRAGATKEEIGAALAEKTKEWYTGDKIFSYISQLTGGFARVAGGAYMLDKVQR